MKTIKKYFWQLLVVFLLLVIFLLMQCTPKPKQPTSSHSVDTITDTIYIHDTIIAYTPAQTIFDTVYPEIPFDTLALIQDYFKVIISNDTLRGGNYEVAIEDVITRNRIQKRSAVVTVKEVITTIHEIDSIYYTTECPKLKTKVYAGFGVGGWTDKAGFAPAIAVNTKKDNLYTAEYDIINKIAWIHTYWKIRLRR